MLSTFLTVSAMALSSIARNSAADISPFFHRSRFFFTSTVLNKLPTWSARKGGWILRMMVAPRFIINPGTGF
jgi:hypothetical protein